MNEADYNYLIHTTRPINYGISKSFERKISLDLTIGSLVALQIYCCVIHRVFLNIRSEKNSPLESFKLLSDFLNSCCETTEILM